MISKGQRWRWNGGGQPRGAEGTVGGEPNSYGYLPVDFTVPYRTRLWLHENELRRDAVCLDLEGEA